MAAWTWSGGDGPVRVRFAGRGEAPRGEEIAAARASGTRVAWARQVHSAGVLRATAAGETGEGDALVSGERGLALAVVTADCVPVLVATASEVAAIHAGWRGLVAGVVEAALERLAERPRVAWIGPAIGPCCYEVGDDVAAQVVAATTPAALVAGPGRPHLDLKAAVAAQLRRAGVERVVSLGECTRCAVAKLWSFRRDGRGTGRNVALVWRGARG